MEVRHTVIFFFFFLFLQDEDFCVEAVIFHTVPEGGNVRVECSPSQESTRKFFCREDCRERDVIIQTTDVSAQEGRFRIEWKKRQQTSSGDVSVKVSQLTKSDSGRYRCGVGSSLSSASYTDIEIIIVDAKLTEDRREPVNATPGGSFTAECIFSLSSNLTLRSAFFCKDRCLSFSIGSTDKTGQNGRYSIRYVPFNRRVSVFVSISQLTQSDSAQYKCGLTRNVYSDLEHKFEVFVPDDAATLSTSVILAATTPSNPVAGTTKPTKQPGTATTDGLLYVVVIPVIIVVVLGLALTVVCITRITRRDGSTIAGNRNSMNMEIPPFENHVPVSSRGDSTYESLNAATRDQDQTYSTLNRTHNT